jgi:hypothetical protein
MHVLEWAHVSVSVPCPPRGISDPGRMDSVGLRVHASFRADLGVPATAPEY